MLVEGAAVWSYRSYVGGHMIGVDSTSEPKTYLFEGLFLKPRFFSKFSQKPGFFCQNLRFSRKGFEKPVITPYKTRN